MERRTFLKAGAALPALGAQLSQSSSSAVRHSSFDPWVEVHAGHLRTNAAAVHAYTRVPVLAVIKNNGTDWASSTSHARSSPPITSAASPSSSCTRRWHSGTRESGNPYC
jgi:hypothetical protein